MPTKKTAEKAQQNLKEGKSPSTAAGEFVHDEMKHMQDGKHEVKSPEQAIAIGLSKARRAGVAVARKASSRKKTGSHSSPSASTTKRARGSTTKKQTPSLPKKRTGQSAAATRRKRRLKATPSPSSG